ncbi:MAG: cob(I)yrinic acid a,c-diamide adenosyltransferase [Bacteroidales bacterium]|jgi:cob(I)alamin adenosyltransferase|nr:cob(I)yrinic acid a,c-diamide adenosyltransferase [Bacteroidales bacterium]HOL97333.1 cob(I)yrinic acid a,c-diamide adenosyltransferase [Bacteroidales bacterium]HOM36958.1 cob(I)yrinic acid a,c-diamide adenosyltransferase [Bacteroidales bacterium]HPD22899.1 cob(I)yrinic acid a,c-diamide adenosyltransferase [Bacteroidales bacterium]HRS98566.1 cob(I)yrinic acid a,c-diamide adenosyltransferase [Bacteroidales bacterium]
MKLYTKTGDNGKTSLLGGKRVSKDNIRLEAYGTVDELNANVGMVLNYVNEDFDINLIEFIQNKLFDIGSLLSAEEDEAEYPLPQLNQIENKDIFVIEQAIDRYQQELPEITNFIIPAGSHAVSWCHIARTVCRRAERRVVSINDENNKYLQIIVFLNRLSDLFFILARKMAKRDGINEIFWNKNL